MRRMIPIIALFLAPILLFTACAMPGGVTKTKVQESAQDNAYRAEAENEGEEENGKIWPWENPAITLPAFSGSVTPAGSIKSLKVLAIGDASSRDAMELLAKIALEAGIEDIKIAVLCKNGGSSLAQQWSEVNFNRPNYTYYEDTGSGWQITQKAAPKDMLQADAWDYVLLHQNIALSGDAESIDNMESKALSSLLTAVDFLVRSKSSSNKNPNKNPNAKILWMQVWAYENNSRNNLFNAFKNYDNDQMKMYTMGVEAIQSQVITQRKLNGVIPVGTAIQNMRNAYWSDGLTKDAEYLTNTGKVAAAVAIFKALTGYDINGMELSDPAFDHARPHMVVIKESANNAYLNPYEVTPSVYNTAE